ncbi:MAG: A/G-specific adenine glycosylase [Methyloligellaceae bacterium]
MELVKIDQRQKAKEGPSSSLAVQLLAWYDEDRRDLPWRYDPGKRANAYRIWLSEVMLQQTTVKSVIPYFNKFVKAWPTVKKLAAAPLEDVLKAWAGLGYYSRARNLHECARTVVRDYGGKFPATVRELQKLPGIGPYTAAAVAAIAYGQRATVVDGNVERVISRLFAIETPLPKSKPEIKQLADGLTPDLRPGDYAQAMMDLGATICSPKRPSCMLCPISANCDAHAKGNAQNLPARMVKAKRPVRQGVAFFVLREDGFVLLRERPREGLLGGMMEIPSTDWMEKPPAKSDQLSRSSPVNGDWWKVPGLVTHTFTHFKLEMTIYRTLVEPDVSLNLWAEPDRCRWVAKSKLSDEALPSLMRKVISHALGAN